MSASAAQADAFFREVLEHGVLWGIKDDDGFPAPETPQGRAMPFWSRESRARRVVDEVAAFRDFAVVCLSLDEWRERWLPGLARDGLLVGINWSGDLATGYDLTPREVEQNLAARETG